MLHANINELTLFYQSTTKAESTQRQVDPYALVHRSGWWYLVGYCHLRDAPRTFRVDRIQNLELLSQTFQTPDDFEVHAYLEGEFADQPAPSVHGWRHCPSRWVGFRVG